MYLPIDIVEIDCCNCHIIFWITKKHNAELLRRKSEFYCPRGHSQSYTGANTQDQLDKQKALADRLRATINRSVETEAQLRRQMSAYKGHLTKLKNKQAESPEE